MSTSVIPQLLAAAAAARHIRIESLYAAEADRLDRFRIETPGLLFDFSKALLPGAGLDLLLALAGEKQLEARRGALFAGEAVNLTEDRAVLHMALRDPAREWSAKGVPVSAQLRASQAAATAFADALRAGQVRGADGRALRAVLHLGIGGSDLGPRLIHEALAPHGPPAVDLRFAGNVEPGELAAALDGLDPRETLVVCVSKTFTTTETLANLAAARRWLQGAVGADDGAHLAAVSAAPERAAAMGFAPGRVFDFRDWVGGRFSLWSSVGLSCEMALGPDVVARLRAGAAGMDHLFETAPAARNPAVIAALVTWWNRTALGFASRAVIPYARRLRLLPAFLQQLDMESNGKGVDLTGAPVSTACPVVWGAEGTNAQHAFFQHLHQSPDITPVEFVALARDGEGDAVRTRMTLANALAQGEALMRGRGRDVVEAQMRAAGQSAQTIAAIAAHRVFAGNRPSGFILMEALSPETLGALLAFHEHRVFVEGLLWGVNSFDQWGVELGKTIAGEIERDLVEGPSAARDPGSAALIRRLQGGA